MCARGARERLTRSSGAFDDAARWAQTGHFADPNRFPQPGARGSTVDRSPPRCCAEAHGAEGTIPIRSRSSSWALISTPAPKPVNLPLAPITRWQGMTMAIGFRPLARPTARGLPGGVMALAMLP